MIIGLGMGMWKFDVFAFDLGPRHVIMVGRRMESGLIEGIDSVRAVRDHE